MQTKKRILKDISVNTMNELLCTYDFILPRLYENIFQKKAREANVMMEDFCIEESLNEVLDKIEKTKNESEIGLSKLSTICKEAQQAIRNKNINTLATIEEEAKEVVAILKNMEYELYTDEITGLLNRKGVRHNVCNNREQVLTFDGVMFIFDLDNFKQINDTHGHAIGDAILKAFGSQVIKKCVANVEEKKRFTARLGGDEFMVIANADNMPHIKSILRKMQSKGLRVQLKSNEIIDVKFSFGSCLFALGKSFDEAFILADKNMYKNKKDRKTLEVPSGMKELVS